ncbi:hypothetical protein Q8A67_019417 [Cirrhinus molitorella]|uniref:Ig-like domain-containing protein n=1 Tax=Cirrhinus molitorella TaxID=172907 RepID=A0AA88PLK0_9TELE|nr:hypothetical protein Q8A67_019417 [Cirrhinus molitorella]
MHWHFAIVFVTLQWPATISLQVDQNPLVLILQPGQPLKVVCSITGTDNPNLYWYRWTPTDGFKLMFSSLGVGMVDPASVGDFSSNRPGLLQIVLESKSVTEVGSVVWFCAASPHSTIDSNESCTKTPRDKNCFLS